MLGSNSNEKDKISLKNYESQKSIELMVGDLT
jgi:hypothetical protein